MLLICWALVVRLGFFFKQKPAYEMRISDWISDVCSSDLIAACFTDSGWRSSVEAPVTASTVATTPSSRKQLASTGSRIRVWMIGAGSASPVVSITTRKSLGEGGVGRYVYISVVVGSLKKKTN